jgi:hypothetical protein
MQNTQHFFLIESKLSGHKLFLDGQEFATFATLEAAEAEANKIGNRVAPGARLRFDLAFKWTFSELEIRGASLEWDTAEAPAPR